MANERWCDGGKHVWRMVEGGGFIVTRKCYCLVIMKSEV